MCIRARKDVDKLLVKTVYKDYNLVLGHTLTAVLPHPQVDLGHVLTVSISVRELRHGEDVRLNVSDVVAVVTQHPGERCLLQLSQLSRAKHARVLIPEPEKQT